MEEMPVLMSVSAFFLIFLKGFRFAGSPKALYLWPKLIKNESGKIKQNI